MHMNLKNQARPSSPDTRSSLCAILGGSKLPAEAGGFNSPMWRQSRLVQLSMILVLIAGIVYHNNALSDPPTLSERFEKKPKCNPPGFWRNGECWVILQGDEDCIVQPIIVELEDQPVYCPKNKIMSRKKTDSSRAVSSD